MPALLQCHCTRRYPDPVAMTQQLHNLHMHFMVTFWPNVDGPLKEELGNHSALIGGAAKHITFQQDPDGSVAFLFMLSTTVHIYF